MELHSLNISILTDDDNYTAAVVITADTATTDTSKTHTHTHSHLPQWAAALGNSCNDTKTFQTYCINTGNGYNYYNM